MRGLYKGFNQLLKCLSLVFLVRDPLINMKSFLNRNKNFFIDNSSPSAKNNLLKFHLEKFSIAELYLWAWSETFLRFHKIAKSKNVLKSIIFRTEDLDSPDKVTNLLDFLEIKHIKIRKIEKLNTNQDLGLMKTFIIREDINLLESFLDKIPVSHFSLIKELNASLKKHKRKLDLH